MPVSEEIKLKPLAEAASELRIKPATLRAWSLAGKLPFVKLGRQIMFLQSDLDQLVRSSRVAG
jgi:excisionase family DNA binding protein